VAADLHIHVLTDVVTSEDLADFFASHLGSKWFDMGRASRLQHNYEAMMANHKKIGDTPNVWIGEVSWLKADLTDDAETFVPDPIGKIHDLIGEELPTLDDETIAKIVAILRAVPNQTQYRVTTPEKVMEFLVQHRGKRVFQVSW
jgi:hypothetical protein